MCASCDIKKQNKAYFNIEKKNFQVKKMVLVNKIIINIKLEKKYIHKDFINQ